MKTIRAVLFDAYQTLLEVLPSPPDTLMQWDRLWREMLGSQPRLTHRVFARECDRIIGRELAAGRARGIAFPEVYWPAVAAEAAPELAALTEAARDEFLYRHARLWNTVKLMDGAAETLRWLRDQGIPMGLVSNAQPYTLRELDEALSAAGLSLAAFDRALCFWSFEHGFSKPDPHVFRLLTVRLQARGISAEGTLMVGDRLDNDISPAQAAGWQTWLLTPRGRSTAGETSGAWPDLLAWLARAQNPTRAE